MRQSKRRHPKKGVKSDTGETPKSGIQRMKPVKSALNVDGKEDTDGPCKMVNGRNEKGQNSKLPRETLQGRSHEDDKRKPYW